MVVKANTPAAKVVRHCVITEFFMVFVILSVVFSRGILGQVFGIGFSALTGVEGVARYLTDYLESFGLHRHGAGEIVAVLEATADVDSPERLMFWRRTHPLALFQGRRGRDDNDVSVVKPRGRFHRVFGFRSRLEIGAPSHTVADRPNK